MKNHDSHIFKILQGRSIIGLTTAIIASLILLSPAMGCTTSESSHTATKKEMDRTQTPQEIIQTEEAEDERDQDEHINQEDLRLIDAVDQGDVETLRHLLQQGADPNETDVYGSPPPLWVAVAVGNLEMVKLLLDAGADPDKPGPDGTAPALLAAELGNPEILATISGAGGSAIPAGDDDVETMIKALGQRNSEMIRVMIGGGADPNTQVPASAYVDADADGVRDLWLVPILYEAVKGEQPDTVQTLLDAGADPNATGFVYLLEKDPGNPQENIAALFGVAEDPTIESSPYGEPPLHLAINKGYVEIVQMLLSSGADTEIPNRSDETALIAAIQEEEVEIARLLIEAGANLNVTGGFRRLTPVELAEDNRDTEMVELLREATR